ncbi:MAG: Mut7-C RNAse domain-containing protein [Desulfobacterales bacterium]
MPYLFAVDRSLGSLAKWLRILGFDAVYQAEASDREFFDRLENDRVLITRTQKIHKAFATHHHVFITSNGVVDQLKQVVNFLGIKPDDIRPLSRCLHCNLPIEEVSKQDICGLVPDYVWENHDAFNRCDQCKRIYWSGSHTENCMDMIKQIFDNMDQSQK